MQCCAYQDKYEDLKLELEAAKAGVASSTKDAMEWALKARRAEVRLEQFIGIKPIDQADGVERFSKEKLVDWRDNSSDVPFDLVDEDDKKAYQVILAMALESLDIPRHHAMISTLMKENEKLRNALGDQYK